MSTISQISIGVDISKDKLDVYIWENKEYRIFNNNMAGVQEFIKWIKLYKKIKNIVFEASGGYENDLKVAIENNKLKFWLVDPRLVRYFIKSEGIKAKTDKIDAKMLAHFAFVKNAKYDSITNTPEEVLLKSYVERRRQLIDMKQSETNRLRKPKSNLQKSNIQEHIDYLKQKIVEIENEIDNIMNSSEIIKEKEEVLTSVPGFGKISSASLISELPEIGKISNKEISALVGVAPYNKQSGSYQGKQMTAGGRRSPRRTLYMSTLVAIRYNFVIKDFYQKLIAEGKQKKVAIVACMRKLICILNTMIKKMEKWMPQN